jgi:subfamily B ATP-binding cassette protein HlyB/CyaB
MGVEASVRAEGPVPDQQRGEPLQPVPAAVDASLAALCAIARLHHVSADAATLAHQLGLAPSQPPTLDDLLRAAHHLGLKAKLSATTPDRLSLTPLPALAVMPAAEGAPRIVILAQCDGQRVLVQDPGATVARPVIEPLEAFARQWAPQGRGELILITSRASLAGDWPGSTSLVHPQPRQVPLAAGRSAADQLLPAGVCAGQPLFFQVVMDKVLVHRGLTTLDVLVIGTGGGRGVREPAQRTAQLRVQPHHQPHRRGTGRAAVSPPVGCRWPTSRRAGWATRWPACASSRTSAAS